MDDAEDRGSGRSDTRTTERTGGRPAARRELARWPPGGPERRTEPEWNRAVPVKVALNRGMALRFDFEDPDGNLIEVDRQPAIACRPRPAALNRVIGDYRGTSVARVGHLAEWHLLLVSAFGHPAFHFGAGLGEPPAVVLPPLLQARLEPVRPVGDPMG